MGSHIEWNGDPEVTPLFVFNSSGAEGWGGVHESSLSGSDVVRMLCFCEEEGYRKGWNDACYDSVLSSQPRANSELLENNPFHPDLLGGFPHQEWARSYERGVQERRAHPVSGDAARST